MTNLNTKAWLSLTVLAIVMGLLLFVPAWTVHYWQAWVYLSIFTGASILTTLYLMRHDPMLLERRMRAGPTAERQPAQRLIMLCTSIGFIALLVVPALDVRFGWSAVPLGGVVVGDVLVVTGFYCISLVYRENTFTSATIEVAEDQKVISSGTGAILPKEIEHSIAKRCPGVHVIRTFRASKAIRFSLALKVCSSSRTRVQ
jgi:hypothetical protein